MKPLHEIDALCAEKVAGWTNIQYHQEAQRQEEYYQQETEPQPEEPTPGESG